MLSLVRRNATRMAPQRNKRNRDPKDSGLDVVVIATYSGIVTDKQLKAWRGCPGIVEVNTIERHMGRATLEIIVDGSKRETGWHQHFGTKKVRHLPQAVLDRLNRL